MKIKEITIVILIVIINIFIYFRWFSFSIFRHGDWVFYYSEKLRELALPTIWATDYNFGSVDLVFWRLPIQYIYSIFGNLGLNSNFLDVFFYFIPIVVLLPLGGYFLIKSIVKSEIGALIGSLVISFNTYFLAISTQGHIMINDACAFSIIAILFFIKAIDAEKGKKYYILSALFLSISTFYDLRISYITIFILCFYSIFSFSLKSKIKKTASFFFEGFIFLLIFIALNLYWFLPQIMSGSLLNNTVLNRPLFGNSFWNIQYAFNLFHPFWTGDTINWFQVQKMPAYFWLIPLFAFLGLILNKKNKNILFFGFISILGIFLSKQAGIPFPDAYQWLYDHFPGFNAFREASKFYFLIILGYSILISSFTSWIWQNWNKNNFQLIGKYALTIFLAGLFLWNTQPIINEKIGTMFTPRQIPNDYLMLKDFILQQPEYFRTFWTPIPSNWGIYTNNHPKVNNATLIQNEWSDFADSSTPTDNWSIKEQIASIYDNAYNGELFRSASIKYVIVPHQDTENDDNFYDNYGKDRNYFVDILDKENYLRKVNIGTKDLILYENNNVEPYVSASDKLFLLDDVKNLNLKYDFISPLNKKFDFALFSENDPLINIGTHISLSKTLEQFTILDEIFLRKVVEDCHNYDDNPQISLRPGKDANSNLPSIQLEAANHIACTTVQINVKSGKEYVLNFDYQSPNNDSAKYYLSFNDGPLTNMSEIIPIYNNKEWQHFERIIKIPNDASQAILYIYAEPNDDDGIRIINRYKNVTFYENKNEISHGYYIASDSKGFLKNPEKIDFEIVSPTKTNIHIVGASHSFILNMSEAYHPQWQLLFNNKKNHIFGEKLMPFAKVDSISGVEHFKLNNFLNGWFINLSDLCDNNSFCIKNNDGTYNIELTIEFWPQRWFYLGFIISIITLLGCIIYLIFYRKREIYIN